MIQQLRLETEEGAITPSRLADVLESVLEVAESGSGSSDNGGQFLIVKATKNCYFGYVHDDPSTFVKLTANKEKFITIPSSYNNKQLTFQVCENIVDGKITFSDSFWSDGPSLTIDITGITTNLGTKSVSTRVSISKTDSADITLKSSIRDYKSLNGLCKTDNSFLCNITLDFYTGYVTDMRGLFDASGLQEIHMPHASAARLVNYTDMFSDSMKYESKSLFVCPLDFKKFLLDHADEVNLPEDYRDVPSMWEVPDTDPDGEDDGDSNF